MAVTAVMTDSCRSLGDALREVDAQSLVRTDFLLVSGDIVANMDFGKVVKEHKLVVVIHAYIYGFFALKV